MLINVALLVVTLSSYLFSPNKVLCFVRIRLISEVSIQSTYSWTLITQPPIKRPILAYEVASNHKPPINRPPKFSIHDHHLVIPMRKVSIVITLFKQPPEI